MNRNQLQDLIQADLDGELSVTERAELARELLRDPESRRLHQEFLQTDQLLRDIPAAESPPGLRAAILAGRAQSVRPADSGHRQYGWRNYRVAAAILGGMLIVGISYLWLDGNAPGTDLQGSMGATGGPENTRPTARSDHLSLRAEGAELNALLRRDGERLTLELNSSTTIPCEVIARIDPATTTFVGSPGDAQLNTASGQVTVQLATGSQDLVLDFSGVAPIRLELRSGRQLLGEGSLSIGDR